VTDAGAPAAGPLPDVAKRPAPNLYNKLLALTGARILVGTALLGATAWLTLGSGEEFVRSVEGLLYGIIASIYVASLISVFFLRAGRYLTFIGYAQMVGDIAAATGLVYLTGGAESIFTILYPLAIVNGAIGLSRKGANIAALCSTAAFLFLSIGSERGFIAQPAYLEHVAMPTPRLLLTLAANLSAFFLTAALAGYLADALVGARRQLKRAESELTALSALHESIVHSISSGILTIDGAQQITFINPAGEEISGRTFAQLRGKTLREDFPAFADALSRGQLGRGETVFAHADLSERVLGYSLAPLVDPGMPAQPGFVVVFQDLSNLRRMEESVRRSDRLAAVGQLAAGLAHEIRNPLASMTGSIELLAGAPQLDANDRRLMKIVLRESERLELLVRDFLTFAKPKPVELARLSLSQLVSELLEVFQPTALAAGLAVLREIDQPVFVRGDESLLRQLVWNLLRNAADATPSGGSVRVQVRADKAEAQLVVQDSGAGISASDRARIFEPFFTTKEGGSGLGLAIVQRTIEAHGGRVELESSPGRGSTFIVIFPLSA
jgi:two-component system sensor histidine kinase PilS (NtrC family)